MIKKITSLEDEFSVGKAAAIIGFFTLLAKIVGFVRDPLFATKLGVGDTLDIYYAAFRIPDFVFNLLILGTLSVALIPIFTEWLLKDKSKAYQIVNSVLNISILAMGVLCLFLFAFSPYFTKLLVPGFSGEKLSQTIQLMRLFLLSPIIFTASNIFSSVLNSQKKFLIVSLAPILYNAGIIAGLFFLYPKFGLLGLGYGVIFGALMHLCVQIPEAIRFGFTWQPIVDLKNPALRKIAKLFLPRIIGMDISQISLIVATTIGSVLAAGSVATFTLANNLQAAPLGIFALSIATASFPVMSELYAKEDNDGFVNALGKNISQVLFFIIPISILMVIFRAYIIRIPYGHGKVGWDETIGLFNTFGILTFSLIGQSLSPLFSRSFYARHNTVIPVMVNLCSIVLDIVLAFTLGKKYGLSGIAAGFVIACTFDALCMFLVLRWKLHAEHISLSRLDKDLGIFITKLLGSSILMGFVSYACIYIFAPLVNTKTTIGILIQSGLAVAVGLAVFLLIASKLGLSQAKRTLEIFNKFRYTKGSPRHI